MTIKNADMPAMPIIDDEQSFPLNLDRYGENITRGKFASGLTKREMMAMHMMASIITQGAPAFIHAAEDAVNAADALLAELERTK